MVDLCLAPPHWGNNKQQQKPTYKAANGSSNQQEQHPSPKYKVDSVGSGTSTKSCFSLFSSGKKAQNSSSNYSSSESSRPLKPPSVSLIQQADDFAQTWEAFQQNNSTANNAAAASKLGEQQQQQQQDGGISSFGQEGQEDIGNFASLLEPPKPTDRSHKQRLRLEKEKRQSGVYDGELEPEGKRGQEAKANSAVIVAGGGSAQTSTPMRDFDGRQHNSSSIIRMGRSSSGDADAAAEAFAAEEEELQQYYESQHQQLEQQQQQQQQQFQHAQQHLPAPKTIMSIKPPHLETIAELSESRATSDTDSWSSQQQRQQQLLQQQQEYSSYPNNNNNNNNRRSPGRQRYPSASPRLVSPGGSSLSRSVDPPGTNSFESTSTSSDEDISKMMSDFLNTSRNSSSGLQSSLIERDYPNPIHMPKTEGLPPDNNMMQQRPQSSRSFRSDWTPSPQHAYQSKPIHRPNGHNSSRAPVVPITVSESSDNTNIYTSGGSSAEGGPSSPHRDINRGGHQHHQHHRITLDSNASSGRGVTGAVNPLGTSFSGSEDDMPHHHQFPHHPHLRHASQRQQALQPPQNQHSSPHRSISSASSPQRSTSSSHQQQPDPEGQMSPPRRGGSSTTRQASSPSTRQIHSYSPRQQPSSLSPPRTRTLNQQQQQQQQPQSIDDWNALALEHVQNGEYDMALAAFQHVLRAYKNQHGNVHPLVASAYHNLGTVHAKRAQLLLDDTLHQRHCRAQSLQCFQSAARAARDSLGRDHPNVAVSLVRIGFLLLQARQYNNAVITFQEALRIRQTHYGPHHALVANLYNNLGVCYMHLGQFAHGRDLLHHALTIQRTLLRQAQEEAMAAAAASANEDEKKDGNSTTNVPTSTVAATTSQALELADTLFNIGGLALEWIRRQGPDVRHAEDAEAAFEEALELRKSVLGPKDPMVLQVKSLLDMARSIPRPKSPGRRATGTTNNNKQVVSANGNAHHRPETPNHHQSSGRPPDPVGFSPNKASVVAQQTARKENGPIKLSPPRQDSKSSSPYRHYGKSDTDSTSPPRHSPSRSPNYNSRPSPQQQQQQQQQQQFSSSSPPVRYNGKADYLEPPRVTRRSLLDQAESETPPEKPRHALSPTTERMSHVSSSASTVKVSPGRGSVDAQPSPHMLHRSNPQLQQRQQSSVFRPEERSSKKQLNPPVMEIKVSQDEDGDGLYDPAALPRPAQTDIFISPHYVPHMSPHKVNNNFSSNNDDTPRSVASSSFSGIPVSTASSSGIGAIQKTYSYDPEEQLVVTDGLAGADNALPDDYDAMSHSKDNSSTRKIMVVRPYRSTPDDSITSPTSVVSKTPWDVTTTTNDGGNTHSSSLYSSELDYSSKTSSYGRDAPADARSQTLERARALLQAHNPDYLDSPQLKLSGQPSFLKNSPGSVKQQLFKPGKGSKYDDDLEDGLAPLGANDSLVTSSTNRKSFHPEMLTNNPDEHMREIYEEASRCLKNHYYDEAQVYFNTILQSQRHLHGPFHHDVASALHNCGLAQLRAGNHHQALKSFEEAVRIRKGTLGNQHPHVAASMVKCGITFLLLRRYEESLWSFREALSIRKHSLGTLHPSTARIYNNIGCVHIEFNELKEARRAFEGALDIQRNALCHDPESGPIRFGTAATLCNLGYLYRYRDMHERAAQVLREAADIQEEILGGTHPTVLSTLDSLAEALVSSGKATEAYVTQETILDRFQATEMAGSRRLLRAEAGLKYKMSKSAKQMKDMERHITNLQHALKAVRALDEQTQAARNNASGLEKKILSDLREARNGEAKESLNWI